MNNIKLKINFMLRNNTMHGKIRFITAVLEIHLVFIVGRIYIKGPRRDNFGYLYLA